MKNFLAGNLHFSATEAMIRPQFTLHGSAVFNGSNLNSGLLNVSEARPAPMGRLPDRQRRESRW